MRTLALSLAVAFVLGASAVAGAQPISAVKLQLKEKNGKGKLIFLSKDTNLAAPAVGSPDDPQIGGATLTLCGNDGNSASFAFVAENWSVNGAGTVYKFKVKGKPTGPKVALLKAGRTLKVVGADAGLTLDGSVGPVGVRLAMGAMAQCALFTTAKADEPGKYDARNAVASALADCSDAALGCGVVPAAASTD